jgi:uncharacterized protein (UPF0333 family)
MEVNPPLNNDHFPSLNDNHHFFNEKKNKHKHSPPESKGNITLPVLQSYSPPNESYLNKPTINQSLLQESTQNDFS